MEGFIAEMEIQRGGQTEVAVAIVVPVVVDVETGLVEIADIDAVAAGVEIFAYFRPLSPESLKF